MAKKTHPQSQSLLAAALTAISGSTVITYDEYNRQKDNPDTNFHEVDIYQSHMQIGLIPESNIVKTSESNFLKVPNNDVKEIFIKTSSKKKISIQILLVCTVKSLKQLIYTREGILPHVQELVFNNQILNNELTLSQYNIEAHSVIQLNILLRNGDKSVGYINSEHLDSGYNYDFTNITDTKKFYRGKEEYNRPCGWKRISVKVLNKYEGNNWLGVKGRKTKYETSPNEWPVSYHATSRIGSKSMADIGYEMIKGKNKLRKKFLGCFCCFKSNNQKQLQFEFEFENGIYTTPDVKLAEEFATRFSYEGENYLVMFQNRVNPNTLVKAGDFWLLPKVEDVRTYGICIKKDLYGRKC
ncbi:ubiquitin-domain-containing protein [Gigaspora margarita]|uniref:Ubiquitin-domain-containing protein n=1 Tax=Gigaspora margarita TaxID=4874 RepID=A0A8H3X9I5_GIGMA|nr:ubiquitin-domain-containing protein [Gigaspora margarita]